jgi:Holliday junction resolvasome RuvABC ATP-dependent DNA helicase subunit
LVEPERPVAAGGTLCAIVSGKMQRNKKANSPPTMGRQIFDFVFIFRILRSTAVLFLEKTHQSPTFNLSRP